jgi:hypothetical protein
MITQGIHGYVHDALDYKAFTASMEKLMVREHSFEQGLAAREKIEPYTLAFMAENLNNLYSSLLSHRSNSFSS